MQHSPNPGLQPLAERLTAIEQRIERAKAVGILPATSPADERVAALAEQVEREIAELEVKFKIQLEAVRRELADTVARLVDEQIKSSAQVRIETLEARVLSELVKAPAERGVTVPEIAPRTSSVLRMPFVHAFFAATLGLLLLHYL
jgi:hypothetical protein